MADTLDLIKSLPAELREKILKEYIKIKLRQRKMQGWAEVHKELEKIPFCERGERFVKAMYCIEHTDCGIDSICARCIRKYNINHYVTPPIDEYGNPINHIEMCDDNLEHKWIVSMLKGLDPMREIFD